MVMRLNDTFNNASVISWRTILLVKETGASGENHWPAASHWQTLSHNISGVANIDATTHLRAQTNQQKKKMLHFYSNVYNKPLY